MRRLMPLAAAWLLLAAGCSVPIGPAPSPSAPTPTASTSAPAASPSAEASPQPGNVAASRPPETPDPFSRPEMRSGVPPAAEVKTAPPAPPPVSSPHVAHRPKPAAPPPAPVTPPSPPDYTLAGIFRSSTGTEAILTGKDGTTVVRPGQPLQDGGVVKTIDPVSRQVVIGKDHTDFVLPLERPSIK